MPYRPFLRTYRGKEQNQNGRSRTLAVTFKEYIEVMLSLPDSWANGYRYLGWISRYTCTTLSYIRRKIFGGDENCYLSLPMKKTSEPAIAMTAHALFLALDNFFRQIVNFSEQSLVRKVAVAYFATIAERQTALPWRLRLYLTAYIPPGPRVGWTKIRSRWVEHYRTTPKVCAWNSQPAERPMRAQSVCGYIPNAYTDVDAMFKRDSCGSYWHPYIIHAIADKMIFRWWEFVQIWNPQKFFVSLCSDWEPSIPKATRSTL